MIRGDGSQNGRFFYAGTAVVVVLLGLGSQALRPRFPAAMDKAGDALWAALVFMLISFLKPMMGLDWRGAIALAIAFAVEFSQMYHAPWIDRLRSNVIGHLVLGMGFDPLDLLGYVMGVALAMLVSAAAAAIGRTRSSRR